MKKLRQCSVVYAGPSYPALHGTRCLLRAPHIGIMHRAAPDGGNLQWWTAEEKAARAREPRVSR